MPLWGEEGYYHCGEVAHHIVLHSIAHCHCEEGGSFPLWGEEAHCHCGEGGSLPLWGGWVLAIVGNVQSCILFCSIMEYHKVLYSNIDSPIVSYSII